MRYILFMLFLCLLFPALVSAQDDAPIIAILPYVGRGDIYALSQGEVPRLLAESSYTKVFLSPDGRKVAYLDFPEFVTKAGEIDPGWYPSDLRVIDIETGTVTTLLEHGDSEPNELFFSGSGGGPGLRTDGQWDDPTTVLGSILFANVAWSPDSRTIAHLQSVVTDQDYQHPTVRLVTFDVESGEENLIAEFQNGIGDEETGYAVFWLEEGIVLYSLSPEIKGLISVYAPDGELLHTWTPRSNLLSYENPVHYEGKDYILFGDWHLFDASTGEGFNAPGTLAMVSADDPETSLIAKPCINHPSFDVVWDMYTPEGEKVVQIETASPIALSPDGQQVVSITHDREITIFDGENMVPFKDDRGQTFTSLDPVWGASVYTLTPIGAEECERTPRG